MKGSIYHTKRHLVGEFRNVTKCTKVPEPTREEIREYMANKKEVKEKVNLLPDTNAMIDEEEEDYGAMEVGRARASMLTIDFGSQPSVS